MGAEEVDAYAEVANIVEWVAGEVASQDTVKLGAGKRDREHVSRRGTLYRAP